ncbi:unnamed protein product [Acanthocheilonema viteae]|uniref:Uncharacterized protein n=1 Tax=Acanthocheilonema viteae TaxID=6277 RepID=A0A498SUP2_ACAVI|nr:unnamed protein product [Acanthocheilonema viteae]
MRRIQLLIYMLTVMLMSGLIVEVEAQPMFTASVSVESDETSGPLDCSFGKLSSIIGHNNFSILGMLQNCAIFYILGDNIKANSNIDLSDIEGSLEYQLVIAQKMSIYTGQCLWQNNSEFYLNCLFDRKQWKKHSIKPSINDDDTEIIGHVTDVDADILHVFYIDG